MNSNDKSFLKSGGKVLGGAAKTMGFFFVLALILTSIAAAQANPQGYQLTLDAGESYYLPSFYAEDGKNFQVGFGIETQDGVPYDYSELDNADNWEVYEYMRDQEWKVQVIIERASDLTFSDAVKVGDYSGEAIVIQTTLQQGFHRLLVVNNVDAQLVLYVGYTTANLGLVVAAIASWTIFGIMVGIFAFLLHVAFWALILYTFVRVLQQVSEQDKYRGQTQYVPPHYHTHTYQQAPPSQNQQQ